VRVIDGNVFHEGTLTAFSTIEKHVGGEGGCCGSEEKQLGSLPSPWIEERSLSANARMARVTGAGSGRRKRRGAESSWQFS
jgi:hypothetical protein